jgi:peptidoglycan-associated lipoprotein
MFSSVLNAKNKESEIADKYFAKGDYINAIDTYKTAWDKETDPMARALYKYRIGISYSRLNDITNAEKNLNDAIKQGYMSAETYIVLGDVQLKLGKMDEAKSSYETYKLTNPYDNLIEIKIASIKFAKENQQNQSLFKVEPAGNKINSKSSEFGISYFNEALLFSSTRDISPLSNDEDEDETSKITFKKKQQKKRYTKEGLASTSVWVATGSNGNYNRIQEVQELSKMKNFSDDGIIIYDQYSKQGYYTRLEGTKAYIYVMQLVNNKWQKSAKIEIQSRGEPIGHPFVSSGGDRIYFTSTMPGGKGKSDIWYISKIGNEWNGNPTNAGDNINSPGNEVYPHISNGYMFFCSDGRIGMGGMDIYASKITNTEFDKPVNLGVPFNSIFDDYNIIIRLDKTGGMLISSRNYKRGADVYKFDGFPSCLTASGKIKDSNTGASISNVSLELFIEDKSISKIVSDANGDYVIPVLPNTTYKLKASVAGYIPSEKIFATEENLFTRINSESGTNLDFALQGSASVISGKVYDNQTLTPLENTTVTLIANGVVQQTVNIDPSGIYKFSDLQSNTNYIIRVDPKGYFWAHKNIYIANSMQQIEYNKNNGHDLDFGMEKFTVGKENIIPNITFQEDKPNLLTASYKELDRFATIIIQNPHCIIALKGYVDTKYKSDIAKKLSQYRVNTIKDYLLSKGINPAQLVSSQGMGSQNPLVRNSSSNAERQINNRISYTVTKIDAAKELEYSRINVANIATQPAVQTNTTPQTGTTQTTQQTTQQTSQQTTQPTSSGALKDGEFIVQVASSKYLNLQRAEYAKITKQLGLDVKYKLIDGQYKYFVGFFSTLTEAKDIVTQLDKIGISAWVRKKY